MEVAAVRGQVGADRVRRQAGLPLPAGHREAEVAPAERRVEHHAPGPRRPQQRQQLGVAGAAGVGRAEVGEDVAGVQVGQQEGGHLGEAARVAVAAPGRAPVSDVDHQRYAVLPRDLLGAGDQVFAVALRDRPDQPQLDARHHAGVGRHAPGDRVRVDLGEVVHVHEARHGVREAADVEVADHAGARVRLDVRGKDTDVGDADRAGVDDRGDAGADADLVGVAALHADAGGDRAVRDVGVRVDQAGHHDPARRPGVDHPARRRAAQVLAQRGDPAVPDPDVQAAVDALAGVEHPAAADQHVERHAGS
ncbi:hypothetical protein Psuf_082990 [Phytohabitans suffuscus]|uniref:Uncharacterized protein n=1 Tax=Phytohabitans suffuscus TaxID=624315 RepID=A0A6F8YY41_9ACTN|nr:hypothetical protein Psuf_082990 [Phytohabitans suffuscus]